MSNVYQLEPPTQGKVVLVTTLGEIEIELWPKEAPKACRNFVQLCLERYYDGTIFHRVIKDFMIQCGDPTGTGAGGDSVYGEPFKDEFHSRLHFNHRGQVAMANGGKPNDNGSQFFITLDKSPWLERKHTIFGRVTGTTIYNALKIGEVEVPEGGDRPVEPPSVLRCDVVWNPFDDIAPRVMKPRADELLIGGAGEEERGGARKRKNRALLSFGDESEVEEAEVAATVPRPRVKSIHDAVDAGDARLVKAGTDTEAQLRAQAEAEWERERAAREVRAKLAGPSREREEGDAAEAGAQGGQEEDFETAMRRKIMEKRRELGADAPPASAPPAAPPRGDGKETREEREARHAARRREKEEREAAKRSREAERLKRLGLTKMAADVDAGLYTAGEVKRREIKAKKAVTAEREKETLARLARFQAALAPSAAPAAAPASAATREGAAGVATYVPQGLYYAEEEAAEEATAWRSHALAFVATADANAYAPGVDGYEVIDPLAGKAEWSRKQQQESKRGAEWAGKSHT